MRKIRVALVVAVCLMTVPACYAQVDNILKAPLGSGGLSLGMSKSRVVDRYGEPDMIRNVTSSDWKEPREEWFYKARYDVLPVNAGYLSKDLYLYFDGDNLTNISQRPIGKGIQDIEGVKDGKEIFR